MDASNLDMLAMMAFLRDAPAIGLHVPGQPGITGDKLQQGIRFLFNRVPMLLPALDVLPPALASKARTKVKSVNPGSGKVWTDAVRTVLRFTASRGNLPILEAIRVTIADGTVKIQATDTKEDASVSFPCDPNHDSIDCVVNGKALLGAVKSANPTELLHVKELATTLRIGTGTLATLALSEYPTLSDLARHSFTLPASELRTLLETVNASQSTEETRYYLNGVLLHRDGNTLSAVSTDGRRLSHFAIPLPAGADTIPEHSIIPRLFVSHLLALLPKDNTAVYIGLGCLSRLSVAWGDTTLTTKLVDGTFPHYQRVMPKQDSGLPTVTLDRASLLSGLAACAATGEAKRAQAKFTLVKDTFTIEARNLDTGAQANCAVTITTRLPGYDIVSGFNVQYMKDIVAQIEGDVVLQFSDDGHGPARLTDTADARKVFVLMPCRV